MFLYGKIEIIIDESDAEVTPALGSVSVEMDDKTIKAVTAVQLSSERHFRFESPLFIDSSGDGFLAFSADAEFIYGREAWSQFNESIAPIEADDYTMLCRFSACAISGYEYDKYQCTITNHRSGSNP